MEHSSILAGFLIHPENRELLVDLFLQYGRAYRRSGRSIPAGRINGEKLKEMIACGVVVQRNGSVSLSSTGRTVGYGLLEYREFRERQRQGTMPPTVDVPFPSRSLMQGKVFVDVGCGSGMFVHKAARAGAEAAFGMEPQTVLRELARLQGAPPNAMFLAGLSEALPLADGVGDIIFLRGVLPYVDNRKTLAEIGRISAPGAELFMTALGPGYYVQAALDAARRFNLLHFTYVLMVLLNGSLYRLLGIQLPISVQKHGFSERIAVFHTRLGFSKTLSRMGFVVTTTRTSRIWGFPARIFLQARKGKDLV